MLFLTSKQISTCFCNQYLFVNEGSNIHACCMSDFFSNCRNSHILETNSNFSANFCATFLMVSDIHSPPENLHSVTPPRDFLFLAQGAKEHPPPPFCHPFHPLDPISRPWPPREKRNEEVCDKLCAISIRVAGQHRLVSQEGPQGYNPECILTPSGETKKTYFIGKTFTVPPRLVPLGGFPPLIPCKPPLKLPSALTCGPFFRLFGLFRAWPTEIHHMQNLAPQFWPPIVPEGGEEHTSLIWARKNHSR